ncbi:hypothetical protein [Plasticicumulans lactativorans]|uniref:hypothetical protein n=1 Tax=Plasticicumulans lactativorans TaxID=1133106 RepID=UPI0010453372|nr:hypothetical protein [Plasticicumulans lactativorans]
MAALLGLVLATTCFVYWPGLGGPFILDDDPNLKLAIIDSLDWNELRKAVFGNYSGQLGRPVAALSFALNIFFSGYDPWPLKYVNLMLHALTGVLICWFTIRLLRQEPLRPQNSSPELIAVLVTALWLLHPLNASTVLYAVQRMALLSALFVVAAMLCYVLAREHLIRGERFKSLCCLLLCAGFGVLGLLSKENGALLPLYILLVEYTAFRPAHEDRTSRNLVNTLLLLCCVLPVVAAIGYLITHPEYVMSGYRSRDFTLTERLLTQPRVLLHYLHLIVLPRLADMGLFQDGFPISRHLDVATALAVLFWLALIAIAVGAHRKHPVITLGIGWFCIAHLLESTVFGLEMVFEHRNYAASYGPLLCLVYYGWQVLTRLRSRLLSAAPWLLYACLLAWLTNARADIFGSYDLFVTYSVATHPASPRAQIAAANLLIQNRGDPEQIRAHIETAMKLIPGDAGPPLHLLITYCATAAPPPALVENVLSALSQGRLTAYATDTLRRLVDTKIERHNDCPAVSPELLLRLTDAAVSNVRQTSPFHVHYLDGQALALNSRYAAAAVQFRMAYDLGASMPVVHRVVPLLYRMQVLLATEDTDAAKAQLDEIIALNRAHSLGLEPDIGAVDKLLRASGSE